MTFSPTKAFNPLRDTIFGRNDQLYDFVGGTFVLTSTVTSGFVAPVSNLMATGNSLARASGMIALQTAGIGAASYAGGKLSGLGMYHLSKDVFELTESQSQSNAKMAEIFGAIATGVVAAGPIQKAVTNKFGLNAKITGSELVEQNSVRRTEQIEIKFKYNEKLDAEEFARQLSNQERGMNKLTIKEYINNRSEYLRNGRSNVSQKLQKELREHARLDKVEELMEKGYSASEANRKANEWIKTQHVLHDPDQIAGGNAMNVTGLGDANVNQSIGSQRKSRITIVDEMIDEFIKTISPNDLEKIYLNIKLVP